MTAVLCQGMSARLGCGRERTYYNPGFGLRRAEEATIRLPLPPMRFLPVVLMLVSALAALAQQAPYPPSLHALSCDPARRQQYGLGSDQWPLTLGPDGHLYAAWGDGWGWTHEPDDPKRSMGVTRIDSRPDGLHGENLVEFRHALPDLRGVLEGEIGERPSSR